MARWLEEGIKRTGIHKTDLARRSEVSRDTIDRILKQESDADPATLDKLSKIVGPLPDLAGHAEIAFGGPGRPAETRSRVEDTPGEAERLPSPYSNRPIGSLAVEFGAAMLDCSRKVMRGETVSPDYAMKWLARVHEAAVAELEATRRDGDDDGAQGAAPPARP